MKNDMFLNIFRQQIESHGMKIDSIDEDGLVCVLCGDLTLKISLENARRNYERDSDQTHITDLVETIINYPQELPEWNIAKENIYLSLSSNDVDFMNFLHKKTTEEFSKVFVYSSEGGLSWITYDDIGKWDITEEELESQAHSNAEILLERSSIFVDVIEGKKLGSIDTEDESLKGALLFAPKFKEKISKDFGFPFYAVVPVRDFCYIFSEVDFDFFSSRLGGTVVKEYKESGYPITTEILKFTHDGVKAIGKYPAE
jgi:hypothetical protein